MRALLDRIEARLQSLRPSTLALLGIAVLFVVFAALASRFRIDPNVLAGSYFVLWLAGSVLAMRRLRFDAGTIGVLVAAFCLYRAYLGYTAYTERNYDGPAQLEYIEHIAKNAALPRADFCFVCHHPPLYYTMAAGAYALFQKTRVGPPILGAQLFSLLAFQLFLFYSVLLARRFTRDVRLHRLAASLVAFWPYSIHNCIRVHNDTLVATFMLMATYYAVVWWQGARARHLYLASLFTGLGILTKSSAYLVAAALAILLVLRFFRTPSKARLVGRVAVVSAILAGALVLNSANKAAHGGDKGTPGNLCEKVLGTACRIGKHQFVGNKPINYVYFDVPSFFKEPYLIAERDDTGRQYFWNDLLKSSLFGTHNTVPDPETAYAMNRMAAKAMNWLLIGMTSLVAFGLAAAGRHGPRRYVTLLVSLAMSIAFMVGFRLIIPAPHHNDFRHVFSALPVVAVLYADLVGRFGRLGNVPGRVLQGAGHAMGMSFALLSLFYFVPKYDWAMRVTARVVPVELSAYRRVVPEATPWDKLTNLFIEGNHTVQFNAAKPLTVREVDTTVDNNDVYEIVVHGDGEPRKLRVGPSKKPVKGLVRYVEKLDPPMRNVERITLRPVSGDRAYSMGHFIVR